jgi:hypothetical protein
MTEAFDKLRQDGLFAAQALLEGDFSEAARDARRANWRWQRLPADEQDSYVNTTLFDASDGPPRGLDDDTERAFLLWFGYRCGLSMAAVRRECEAANEAHEAQRTRDHLSAERAAEARDSTQAALFEAPATKERLQS